MLHSIIIYSRLQIRQKLNNKAQIALSYNNIGIIYQELENYHQAITYHNKALDIYRGLDNLGQQAVSLNYCGNANYKANNLSLALDNYMQALRIRQNMADKVSIAASLNNVGLVYRDMADYQKSTVFLTMHCYYIPKPK
jgi:tetratricopeptide (TPR) repeat protein